MGFSKKFKRLFRTITLCNTCEYCFSKLFVEMNNWLAKILLQQLPFHAVVAKPYNRSQFPYKIDILLKKQVSRYNEFWMKWYSKRCNWRDVQKRNSRLKNRKRYLPLKKTCKIHQVNQVFFKVGVSNNFANFTEKHLSWALSTEKWLQHRCFLVKFAKFTRIIFLQNTSSGCLWLSYFLLLKEVSECN